MYYYIFEPPVGPKEYERTAQIKERLAELGIAGEMAAPQPGRSVEDLVHTAISKRYSTLVAVGGMELINRMARALMPYDAVLGIIPTTNDPDITALIGTADWQAAAEQLKRRRWMHLQLGVMNGTICFLTPATIQLPRNGTGQLETETATLRFHGPAQVRITPARLASTTGQSLLLEVTTEPARRNPLVRLFASDQPGARITRLWANQATCTFDTTQPVIVAGESLTQTPVSCGTEAEGIRVIVGKAGSV
jgi:hypothetical protein